MKNPLFKPTEEKLSPREEAEITQELAAAYRQHELGEKRPEFRRIVENVEKQLLHIRSKENRQ